MRAPPSPSVLFPGSPQGSEGNHCWMAKPARNSEPSSLTGHGGLHEGASEAPALLQGAGRKHRPGSWSGQDVSGTLSLPSDPRAGSSLGQAGSEASRAGSRRVCIM